MPHQYSATVSRKPEVGGGVTVSAEQQLLTAIGACLLSTFEGIARREGIELGRWHCTVKGEVDVTRDGPQFTSILALVELEVGGNIEAVEAALEDTKAYALVANMLRVPVIVEATIYDLQHRKAG